MATFLEAQTRLLREINRPVSETAVLASVKDAINDAILMLQRMRTWTYAETGPVRYTLAANTETVTTLAATGSVLRGMVSCEQLNLITDPYGKPLKIMRYSHLNAKRNVMMRRWPSDWETQFWSLTLEEGYCNDKLLFLNGLNLGIWPMSVSAPVYLKLVFYSWVAALSADVDTNFFLVYAWDVVNALALKKLCFVLKTTSNYLPSDSEFQSTLKALELWDDELRSTSNSSIT